MQRRVGFLLVLFQYTNFLQYMIDTHGIKMNSLNIFETLKEAENLRKCH